MILVTGFADEREPDQLLLPTEVCEAFGVLLLGVALSPCKELGERMGLWIVLSSVLS